jgi:hypothetical protein
MGNAAATSWCANVADEVLSASGFYHDTFASLDGIMGTLSSADANMIHLMGQLLDEGRAEADRITDRLDADDGTGAMQAIARHVHEAPAA